MPKHLVAFVVGMVAMVGMSMAAVPMFKGLENPRTVLTSNVLPCVSLAKPADDPGRAF
jgi:hypothetical protein